MERREFARLWPEIYAEVSCSLTDEGVSWWLNLWLDELGSTVAQALRDGRCGDVMRLASSYLDPSFT